MSSFNASFVSTPARFADFRYKASIYAEVIGSRDCSGNGLVFCIIGQRLILYIFHSLRAPPCSRAPCITLIHPRCSSHLIATCAADLSTSAPNARPPKLTLQIILLTLKPYMKPKNFSWEPVKRLGLSTFLFKSKDQSAFILSMIKHPILFYRPIKLMKTGD